MLTVSLINISMGGENSKGENIIDSLKESNKWREVAIDAYRKCRGGRNVTRPSDCKTMWAACVVVEGEADWLDKHFLEKKKK